MKDSWKNKLKAMSDQDAFKAKISFEASILFLGILTIAVPIRHFVDPIKTINFLQISVSYALCIFAALMQWNNPSSFIGRYAVLLSIFLIIIPAGYYNGGLNAPVMSLMILFPIIAAFLVGKRAAVISFLFSVLTAITFYLLWAYDFLQKSTLEGESKVTAARLVINIALSALSLGIAFLYERTRSSELEARKELERERVKVVHNAKLASLGEMSAGIAHEINNPLAIIAGIAYTLPKFSNNQEKLAEKVKSIEMACQRIAKIVNSLSKFSRTDEESHYQLHSLEKIIQEAMTLCSVKSQEYEVLVSLNCKNIAPILCDEIEIEQVLINLINNAIYAVKELSEKWVRIELFENENSVILQIRDSGRGIDSNIKEKLFQPFFTTKPVGQGTGLGLSIVKGILDAHKASIDILDHDPHTCFEIKLPKQELDKIY
ncbi:MAG: HAMP domain-containing sensor histidine kinase [Proteobacteria bacterium]|nr:HAMP domain-containing sensor histidine kinase [Pseudomonadota bacterium]